jgi:hypothetical protein
MKSIIEYVVVGPAEGEKKYAQISRGNLLQI